MTSWERRPAGRALAKVHRDVGGHFSELQIYLDKKNLGSISDMSEVSISELAHL